MKKILVCENRTLLREGLVSLLKGQPNIELVADFPSCGDLIARVGQFPGVDIVIINIDEETSIERLEQLGRVRQLTPAKILLLSERDDPTLVAAAFKQGIDGLILKENDFNELLLALEYLSVGEKYLASACGLRLLQAYKPERDFNIKNSFTEREVEILLLIASGMTNQQIADEIFISKRTVEGHRRNLMVKLGVKNTAELIMFAFKEELFG